MLRDIPKDVIHSYKRHF